MEWENGLKSKPCPDFPVSFQPLRFNGLHARGDGFAPYPGHEKAPDLAATGPRAKTKGWEANGEANPTSDGRAVQ